MKSGEESKDLIFDSHLDISMNAMEWNRDQRWTVQQIRESEQGMNDRPDRGRNTVSFPAMRDGKVGLVVATQIGRVVKPGIYANGTDSSGRLNSRGVELLRTMEQLHMILDMTHLNDDAFWHTLEIY